MAQSERFIVIPESVTRHSALSPSAKLVYGVMLALARKTEYCFASHEQIGDRVGLSRETVCRSVEQLSAARLLRRATTDECKAVRMKGGYRGGLTNVWVCMVLIEKRRPKLVSMPRAM